MTSVGPVSSLSFCAQNIDLARRGAYDKEDNMINHPPKEEKKSSGSGKKILGTVATLALIASALWVAPKYLPDIFKANKDLSNSKGFKKVIDYSTTYIAKAGEWIDKMAKGAYKQVKSFIPSGKTT